MSMSQTQLQFPVRKSSRRKTKGDKENIVGAISPAKSSSRNICQRRLVDDSTHNIVAINEATIVNSKEYPAKYMTASSIESVLHKQERTPKKLISVTEVVSPSKRQASKLAVIESSNKKHSRHACSDVTPHMLSPSKHAETNTVPSTTSQNQLTPTARKQLSMGGITTKSPKKTMSRLLFDMSPKKHASSPVKRTNVSPRKLLSPRKTSSSLSSSAHSQAWSVSQKGLFTHAKYALNTQQPERLLCREQEIAQVNDFLDSHLSKDGGRPGSLYISGAPGTGKTAVIKHLLEQKSQDITEKIFINAMTVKSPYTMFKAIAIELIGSKASSVTSARAACTMVCKHLTSPGKMVLVVLDEMDQLDCKYQEVLYTIFEWPTLPKSRMVLIGIANALDLTDRILPRLNAKLDCKPELLHFAPYTKDQIVTVIESRLQQSPDITNQVLDKSAMVFCARKVSAVAGDMRKALDICRRSVELAQLSDRKQQLLNAKGGATALTPSSTPTSCTVGIRQVASVIDEVYGSTNGAAKHSNFPLQQKLIVCTLLLMLKSSKLKELVLGKVHDAYRKVCRKRDVTPTDQSEFIGLCQLLETRGLIYLKKAKEARLTKISLKLDAKELEFALQDKLLISSVLNAGL